MTGRSSSQSDYDPPKNWEELVGMREFLATFPGEMRLKEDQEYYDLFSETVPREMILTLIRKQLKGSNVALVRNNFPYTKILQYLPEVKHFLVWSLSGEVSESKIRELVTTKFPDKEWLYFITVDTVRSVPEIWHAHVFVNFGERR